MNLFGEEDAPVVHNKPRDGYKEPVMSRAERKNVLSQIARGKAVDAWIMFRDNNIKVRLTPSFADRIKAVQVLNEMDSINEIAETQHKTISFFDEYLKELNAEIEQRHLRTQQDNLQVQQDNLQDDKSECDTQSSHAEQSQSESGHD